jgi:3D (Asp-Asp-Asp) domain-containing protein
MKISRIIREEIVPLSSRDNLIILIIISSIFQFTLFFTPLLADEAVKQAKAENTSDLMVISSPITKSQTPDKSLVGLIDESQPVKAEIMPERLEAPVVKSATTTEQKVVRTSTHVMTAYNSEPGQTDNSPCITANGFNVCKHGKEDTIAANFLKFGTKVQIPELFGDRIFIVRDRMNKKHPNRVDIWMIDKQAALKFGVKTAKIVVLE